MPIKSFIVHPKQGKKEELIHALEEFPECEIIPSLNEEILILVTETKDKSSDIDLQEKINAIDSLQMLSMVSGFNNIGLN